MVANIQGLDSIENNFSLGVVKVENEIVEDRSIIEMKADSSD